MIQLLGVYSIKIKKHYKVILLVLLLDSKVKSIL